MKRGNNNNANRFNRRFCKNFVIIVIIVEIMQRCIFKYKIDFTSLT